MEIDLSLLHSNTVDSIDISGEYELDKDLYSNTEIINLSKVKVNGSVTQKENDDFELNDYIECDITGNMIIPDSISLEQVLYPFSIKYDDFIDENARKNQNSLDILAFLWENIVLEVPSRYTEVEDISKYHGSGWSLKEEKDENPNNPFVELLNDMDKE